MHVRDCITTLSRRCCLIRKICALHLSLHHVGHLLIALKTHVFYDDGRERAKAKRLLYRKSGIVGVHMYLYDLIVCHDDNRIADGGEILLKIHFLLDVKRLVEHNQKLCAVAEFNLCISLCFDGGRH